MSPQATPVFVAPTQLEVKTLFSHPLKWTGFRDAIECSYAAVYFIRLQSGPAIPRWFGNDENRILYIGSSCKMHGRAKTLIAEDHGIQNRLSSIQDRYRELFQLEIACDRMEILCVPIRDARPVTVWESYFQISYYLYFGDRPPMNRKVEYAYKNRELGNPIAWPEISNSLKPT